MNMIVGKNKGITIIALVVTIVVILILAGITASTLSGNNGLLAQIQKEKENVETKSDFTENKIKELEEEFNRVEIEMSMKTESGTNYINITNVKVMNTESKIDSYEYYLKRADEDDDKYQKLTSDTNQVSATGLIHNSIYDIKIIAKSNGENIITKVKKIKTEELLGANLIMKTSDNQVYTQGTWTNSNINVYLENKGSVTSTYASLAGSAQTVVATSSAQTINTNGITTLQVTTSDGTNSATKKYEIKIDKEAPTLEIISSGIANQYPEVLTIKVAEGQTSIKSITLPDGTTISGNGGNTYNTTYSTTINGPISCSAEDTLGNKGTVNYQVQNVINFETEWTITSASTKVTVPVTGTVNVYIDYGDGTKENVTSQNPTHTYKSAGTYTMKISGNCTKFESNSSTQNYITKLNRWGCLNNTNYSFSNCTKMAGTIPSPHSKSFANLASADSLFTNCSSLTGTIPGNLFDTCTGLKTFSNTFEGCSGLTAIPEELFAKCTGVTSFEYTFNQCNGLTSIPSGLFNKNTNVIKFDHIFSNCDGITSIPATLFANNKKVTHFEYIFYDCDGITSSIPEALFANSPEVVSFNGIFSRCTNISGAIPANLFANNKKVTSLVETFAACRTITTIPSTLLKNNTEITTFEDTFAFMQGLTATKNTSTGLQEQIPTGLFDSCTKAELFHSTFEFSWLTCSPPATLFAKCTEATEFWNTFSTNHFTTIPATLFSKNTKVTSFSQTFTNCWKLTKIPSTLFDKCPNVESFSNTFSSCEALRGYAPKLWSRTNVKYSSGCFKDCKKLSNYSRIPTGWK